MEKKIEKQIKALEVVEEIISNRCQMIGYFYSGDKDTKIEAFSNVLVSKGLPRFYELSQEKINEYKTKFSDEIENEYKKLCEFGNIEFKNANICWDYVKKILNEYRNI